MKNRLNDLVDHLFVQLERLGEESLTGEKLRDEIARAGAIDRLSSQVIGAGQLALKAAELRHEMPANASLPRVLGFDREGQA